MDTWSFLGTVVVTGLGGFDPAPALIGAAALGARTPRRHVLGFAGLLVGGTALLGMVLTALLGSQLAGVDWHKLLRGGATAAWIELAVGVGLLGYGAYRLRGAAAPEKERRRSPAGLYLTALGFVGIVVFDVPFEILNAAAGAQPVWQVIAGWVLWAVISQFPLVALALSVVVGRHGWLVRVMTGLRERYGAAAHLMLGVVLVLVGLFLAADAVRFLALGRFVIA